MLTDFNQLLISIVYFKIKHPVIGTSFVQILVRKLSSYSSAHAPSTQISDSFGSRSSESVLLSGLRFTSRYAIKKRLGGLQTRSQRDGQLQVYTAK
jgi:hypothetical protein